MSTQEDREWDAHNDRIADDQERGQEPARIIECRHCDRPIVFDENEGWIDPEAGYDDEDGDGRWRTTCDSHDTFVAEHEPEEEEEPDGAPCCPDPDCGGSPCTFPGYAANH